QDAVDRCHGVEGGNPGTAATEDLTDCRNRGEGESILRILLELSLGITHDATVEEMHTVRTTHPVVSDQGGEVTAGQELPGSVMSRIGVESPLHEACRSRAVLQLGIIPVIEPIDVRNVLVTGGELRRHVADALDRKSEE